MTRLLRKIDSENCFRQHFRIGDILGSGSFGSVCKVESVANGKVVGAVKRINLGGLQTHLVEASIKEVTLFDTDTFFCYSFDLSAD